ncbi:putative membrane protein [Sulfurihydrogenibium azorense Az-Fu1]|jgi:MFS family permease|uniref:Putative membrane protein n=1 Tax=Sulfurihydrogenibium azorense (strain DSM 15241 / OCM 825 / Az-Fu1) TaxID=204536 RepID=C1DUW0_SULAA|nr:hypothetical protein [Sulfurihydrogenibium azorense]ACN98737.1 putative membrane protein [Sulfurihydrogenibium azorense Az-Fu1]
MKFVITGNVRKNKGVYFGLWGFLIFALLFWLSGFLYYYINFGFGYESLFKYYFTDVDFPEKISIKQVIENVHINLFINSFLVFIILSIFNIFNYKPSIKLFIIVATSISGLLYSISDLIVYYLENILILKPVLFLAFQFFVGLSLFMSIYGLLKINSNPNLKLLKLNIALFSFGIIVFFLLNVLLFYNKIGFCVECVKTYYLGSQELYTKPKTLEGVFKVFYPHLIPLALISFTLIHLLFFTSFNKTLSLILGVFGFISSFIDNLSGLLIRYVSEVFSAVKLLSFFLLELSFIVGFLIVFVFSFKKEPV